MVYVNWGMLKSPLNIIKIITMAMSLVAAILFGTYTNAGFEYDRFNFILTYSLLVLFWCLITLLLYLFDVTNRFDSGTMRTLEIVGAVFLLLLAVQALVYGAGAAAYYKSEADKVKVGLDTPDAQVAAKRAERDEHLSRSSRQTAGSVFVGITVITLIAKAVFVYFCGVPGTPELEPAPA